MKGLFAIHYPTLDAARIELTKIKNLQDSALITVTDAVIAEHRPDGTVKLDQTVHTTAIGAASGAVWGVLFGLLFFAPVVGLAVGAAAGAIAGYASDYGISDKFMKELGAKTGVGATLFIMANDMTVDKIADFLGRDGGEVVYTTLPKDVEAGFKAEFRKAEVKSAL